MKLVKTLGAAACVLLAPALAAAAPTYKRPTATLYDAPGITRACDTVLAQGRKAIAAMEAKAGGAGIFDEWNRLQVALEDVVNPIYLLGNVHPDKAVRDAHEPCLQKYTALSTDLFQNEKLYKRVQAARATTAAQVKLKRDLLDGFEDSGVALPPDKRARAKQIFDKLEELRQAYDRNVRDDPTRVTFTPAEMEGMPEAYLKAHQKNKDAAGNYVLDLSYPSYVPFMANAVQEPAREKYYRAKLSEGGAKNLELLNEIFVLRRELAGLYQLPSFAHYVLRRKMVQKPEVVEKFLDDVKGAVTELEKKEIEELREVKAKLSGKPAAEVKVNRWDSAFLQERVKRDRFAIDQEQLRKYFPTDKAIAFTLLVSEKLYGVRFREAKVPVWHEDVRYFDVLDAKGGKFISGFYLDLFPREGKYNHAAAFPVRGVSRVANRTPISVLVTNFNRQGLDHREMETLLHEFGHVLHGVLSNTDYVSQAGTSVKGDFVEAPSQMFEEWVRRDQALALMKQVCADCPQLTRDQIERLEAARKFGSGLHYARQWIYAKFDMELATNPRPPLTVWKELEAATPLGHVEGTMFPASFSHIAANYAAGYYGYMWSQVIALDMLSRFKGELLDPKVGAAFRREILSQGGQREEMESVRRFLGREPSSDAFFAEITGRR
jgi:thimet oligopeptidase